MMLLGLTLALVVPYLLLTVTGRLFPAARMERATRAKVGVSLLFLITGAGHFAQPEAMAAMLPAQVPMRLELIYLTGFLELLGAIGIWVPAVAKLTGACLIVMLVAVLPANIYAAMARVPFGGHDAGPVYLLIRIPFQILLIGWIYKATGQSWLRGLGRRPIERTPAPLA